MQKRKFKLNILDVAIFVVIVCSVCVLVFRDQIRELVDPPTIINIEVSVKITDEGFDMSVLSKGSPIRFDPDTATEGISDGLIVSVPQKGTNDSSERSLTVVCTGYKKFGLLYTENGDRLNIDSEFDLEVNGAKVGATVVNVTAEQNP